MKPLCIVDASSLIYLSRLALANRSLPRWLDNEFELKYSAVVWGEINRNSRKLGDYGKDVKNLGTDPIWSLSTANTYESILFGQPYPRRQEVSRCRTCNRPILRLVPFDPNITGTADKGERQNCCIALDLILSRQYRQVIFLIDDYPARRNYIEPLLDRMPLGQVWSSHDLIIHLFMLYRERITPEMAKLALRDINSIGIRTLSKPSEDAKERWRRRLASYEAKVDSIEGVLSQLRR